MDHISGILHGWAMRQIGHWPRKTISSTEMAGRLAECARRDKSTFIFDIKGGEVFVSSDLNGRATGADPAARPVNYQQFLQAVVKNYCPDLETRIAIFLADRGVPDADVPIFSFQKPYDSRAVLMPDIDLLVGGFDTIAGFRDPFTYMDKSCTATFAGSTTGAMINEQTAHEMSLPRLRSAMFFRDHPAVDFRLPAIVQANAAATAILRGKGIGDGVTVPWKEQCRHRFLISMDGNGAACSRVLLCLLSNSVLLKYHSPHELHYFDGMRPWRHYLPVQRDEDVLSFIEMERRQPGMFAEIARAGHNFALTFLARDPAMRYTAELLQQYARIATDACQGERMSFVAHIGNVGDVSARDGLVDAMGGRIEGFRIVLAGGLKPSDIIGRVVGGGHVGLPQSAATYCGTRGQGVALRGFGLALSDSARLSYTLRYRGWFADGSVMGPFSDGELCQGKHDSPLRAMEVVLLPKT